MKKYFICVNVQGFYNTFISKLEKEGFDKHNSSHYLIMCGNLFGANTLSQSKDLLRWLIRFNETGRLIIIKSEFEDAMEYLWDKVTELVYIYDGYGPHWEFLPMQKRKQFAAICTVRALTDYRPGELLRDYHHSDDPMIIRLTPYMKLIRTAIPYCVLDNYIIFHKHSSVANQLRKMDTEKKKLELSGHYFSSKINMLVIEE